MNHQAGILRIITSTKNQIQRRGQKILSRWNIVENRYSIFGRWCTEGWHVPCNRSRPREWVPCRRLIERRGTTIGRTTGAAQRGLRRSLAQRRPPATLRKQSRPPQTQFFVALHLESFTTNYHITTSLRSSTAISPSLLPVSGGGVTPAHPRDA